MGVPMPMTGPAETVHLPTRGWRIDRRKALVVGVLCWIGLGFIAFMVQAGRTQGVDQFGLLFWRGEGLAPKGPELVLEMVRDLTGLGGVLLRNLFAIGAVAALLFLRLRREAVLFAATVVSGWLVNTAIKNLVGRPRPEIVPHLTDAGGASFPSGHSFNSAVVYIAMALAFASLSSREAVRLTIIAVAVVGSMLIAGSRVWLGVHFPTDVMAGWLGGAGWAFLAAALLQRSADKVADSTDAATPATR